VARVCCEKKRESLEGALVVVLLAEVSAFESVLGGKNCWLCAISEWPLRDKASFERALVLVMPVGNCEVRQMRDVSGTIMLVK